MRNFVISLTSAQDRREHINSEFSKHNVTFEFFDALTPDLAYAYAQTLDIQIDNTTLASGELACFMSHAAVWQKMIDENLPYLAIFEDDVHLGEDAEHLLNSVEWIKPDWNIIKIEAFAKKALLSNINYDVLSNKRRLTQLKGKNLGAAGYILSSKGAKLLLKYMLDNKPQPVDEVIFDIFINQKLEPIYQMIPALCAQKMIVEEGRNKIALPSSLEQDRRTRMKSGRKKGLSKVKKEAGRIIRQVKYSIYAEEVPFK
jgi:glycosyl transferase family 25